MPVAPVAPTVVRNTGYDAAGVPDLTRPDVEDPINVNTNMPADDGAGVTITDMRVLVREGFNATPLLLYDSDWQPFSASFVLPVGACAPGWRNLLTLQYRWSDASESAESPAAEFYPAWASPPKEVLPARNTLAQMDLPGVSLDGASLTRRPDAVVRDFLTAFAFGPVGFSDASAGLVSWVWRARYDPATRNVWVAREADARDAWGAETLLFLADRDLEEIDLAFDQNGRPFACAQYAGAGGAEVWLYWYNLAAGGFVFEKVADGRNPRLLLDQPGTPAESDVLLCYVSDAADHICYRVQSEVYATEHLAPITRVSQYFLEDIALNTANRFVMLGAVRDPTYGTWALALQESAPYPFAMDPDAAEPSASLQSAAVVEVMIYDDMGAEAVDPSVALVSLVVADLTTILALDPEAVDPSVALQSAVVVDLVIQQTLDPEAVDPSASLQSAAVVTVTVVQGMLTEAVDPSAALVSATLTTV